MKKLLAGKELEERCQSLGIDTQGAPRTQSSSGNAPKASDYELQRRLFDAERSIRESGLWVIALVSAIASVASAATALFAVLRLKN